MAEQTRSLSYAIRWRVVATYLGQLLLILGALTSLPLAVAMAYADWNVALRHAAAMVGLAGIGAIGARLGAPERVQTNEAMVITTLAYLSASLAGAIALAGHGLAPIDAIFESVSGVTTTGLTMAGEEIRSTPFLFARAWAQWYGGLGIVVFSMALVIRPGLITRRLAESAGTQDDQVGGARALARRTLLVYGVMTCVGVLALLATGAGVRDSVLLCLTGVSTGGFAPSTASLAGLSWPTQIVAALLGLAGATSFVFYIRLQREGLRAFAKAQQLRMLLIAALLAMLLVSASLVAFEGLSWGAAALHGSVMAISAQTTTGFATLEAEGLSPISRLALIVSMAIGGEFGSTAGGIKILRLLILLQLLRVTLVRAAMPHRAVVHTRVGRERLNEEEIREALLVILLFIGVIMLSWAPFVAAGHDPMNALFEVVSATGTVGLSTGICGPDLAWPLKLVLCADMLLGRLEILAWLVLLHPRTWVGHRGGTP